MDYLVWAQMGSLQKMTGVRDAHILSANPGVGERGLVHTLKPIGNSQPYVIIATLILGNHGVENVCGICASKGGDSKRAQRIWEPPCITLKKRGGT